jgi:hypothetical protein
MGESLKIGVTNTATPGADTNSYIMFDSTVTFGTGTAGDPRNQTLQAHCISRVIFGLDNSHLGTLKAFRSNDKGTNWKQIGGDISVAAASSTDISGPYDFLVDTYSDFRITWVNGGSAQTTWRPEVTAVRGDRASGT